MSTHRADGSGSGLQRSARRIRTRRWLLPALLVLAWLALGGALGPLAGRFADVAETGATAHLPAAAESREVLELAGRFAEQDVLPAIVVYSREGGLSGEDRAAIQRDLETLRSQLGDHLAGPTSRPALSSDGEAVQLVVPFAGSDILDVEPSVLRLRALLDDGAGPPAFVTGPAGIQADLRAALDGIDLLLVGATSAVILVILIAVYRSPLLPLLVLLVAGTALALTQGVLYLLVRAGALSMGAEVQGILNVLVLGAGTDYALLMVSRFREELLRHANRYDAAWAAWRGTVGPITASASTVALGLLCLLVSDLGLNSDLGPAGAIGIGCALAAMLSFLPAALVLLGRAAFWPFSPTRDAAPAHRHGRWGRVAGWVGRRPRTVWVGTALVLALLSLGVLRLDASGISDSELITTDGVDSALGQQVLAAHFPAGAGAPAVVVARAEELSSVVDAARRVDGVASVEPYSAAVSTASAGPVVVGGLARADVTLTDAPDSEQAQATVSSLREAVHAVPGAAAKVGGYTAIELDFNAAAARDRIVMPLLLAVVLAVLALLLRSLVAPLLLLATVVLSFLAAVGVSAIVFVEVFGFPGVDSTYPLHAFVFLVALGVDYNIFLMHRTREEARTRGTRDGMLRALVVTGGVITSAGVVLAATFSALALIPLVLLIELAFTVAFGVLLDTLVVRSLLVPALTVDTGDRIWWPARPPGRS